MHDPHIPDAVPAVQTLTDALHELLEREAPRLNATPQDLLAALAVNTAALIYRHCPPAERPSVRVQFGQLISDSLKRMDAMEAEGN